MHFVFPLPRHFSAGSFVGDTVGRAYLYVVARDGSLRIIDVAVPGDEMECETNFDPLANPSLTPDIRCIKYDPKTVKRRQYSITLSGTAEIEVGDGTVARVGPGDIVLAEDLTGQGHVTRVVGNEPRLSAIVPLT